MGIRSSCQSLIKPCPRGMIATRVTVWLSGPLVRDSGLISYKSDTAMSRLPGMVAGAGQRSILQALAMIHLYI